MDVMEQGTLEAPLSARAADVASVPLGNRAGVDVVDMPPIPRDCGHRLTLNYVTWDESYFSPRHRHTFDQIRYVISGRHKVGHAKLGPGDILYVPEGAHYGPQEIIGPDVSTHVNIQMPGPSHGFYPHADEQREAAAALAKIGQFKEGIYKTPDGRNMDSFEAVHQQITGTEPEYPAARVDGPIVFHTSAIEWRPVEGREGVSVKHVAYLNEVGPNVKLIRLDPGASLPASDNGWEEVRFLIEGDLRHRGESFSAPSGFYCPDYLHYGEMGTEGGATLVVVQTARDWRKAPPFLAI